MNFYRCVGMICLLGFAAGYAPVAGNSASAAGPQMNPASAPAESADMGLSVIRQNVRKAEQALQSATEQIKPLEQLQDDLRRQRKQLKRSDALAARQAKDSEALERELQSLKSRLARLEKQVAIAAGQAGRLETTRAEYEKTRTLRQAAESRIQSLVEFRQAAEKEIASLNAKMKAARQRQTELEKQSKAADRLQADRDDEKRKCDTLLVESARESKLKEAAEKEILRLKNLLVETEKAVADKSRDPSVSQAQEALAKEKQRKAQAQIALQNAIRSRKKADNTAEDLSDQVADAEKRLQRALKRQPSIESLKAELKKEQALRAESESTWRLQEEARAGSEKQIGELKAKLTAVGAEETEIKRQVEAAAALKDELVRIRESRDAARLQAEKAEQAAGKAGQALLRLRTEWNNLTNRIAHAKRQLEEVKQIQGDLAAETTHIRENEARIQQAEKARAASENTMAELKRQIADAEKQAAKIQKETKDLDPLRAELEQKKKRRLDAEATIERLAEARTGMAKEIADLIIQRDEIKKQLAEKSTPDPALARLQANLDSERAARAAAEDGLKREQKTLASAERTRTDLREEYEDAEKRLAKMRAKQADALKKIQVKLDQEKQSKLASETIVGQLVSQRAAVEKEISEVKARLADAGELADERRKLDQVMRQAQAALDQEVKLKAKAQAKVEREETECDAADKALVKLRRQCADKEKMLAEYGRQVQQAEQLKAEVATINRERQEAESKAQAAVTAREAAMKELDQITSQLAVLEKQSAEREEQVKAAASLKAQLANEQKLKEAADRRARELKQAWARLDEQVREQQDVLADAERRLAAMQRDVPPQGQLKLELEKARQAQQQAAVRVQSETNLQARLQGELTLLSGKTTLLSQQAEAMSSQFESLRQSQVEQARERKLREAAEARIAANAEARKALERQVAALGGKLEKLQYDLQQEADRKGQLPAQADKLSDTAPDTPQGGIPITTVLAEEQRILAEARAGSERGKTQEAVPAGRGAVEPRPNNRVEAERHYQAGIQKWDQGDSDGAVAEFKKTLALNPDAAGAYYNLGLVFLRQDDKATACDYAYKAGCAYLKNKNLQQAWRMVMFLKSIDSSSRLVDTLRNEINKQSP